ncbi:MAG: hypothetical protein KME01_05650 [Chroococcus sp. CMT-3BRIN-NPC107]|jgi:hypothetical protein|nr:hypothetical protein [Chroococcus sp. CMT-3BRIN-NPC107]
MRWDLLGAVSKLAELISILEFGIKPFNGRRKKRKEKEDWERYMRLIEIQKLEHQIISYDIQINALGIAVSPLTLWCFSVGICGSLFPVWLWVKLISVPLGVLAIMFIDQSSTKKRKKLALVQKKQQIMHRVSVF